MTRRDAKAFAVLMAGLAETFDLALTPTRTELYFTALEDLAIDQVEEAVRQAVRAGRFFPKPAELRARVEPSPGDHAEVAWLALVTYFREHGYELDRAAVPLWSHVPGPHQPVTAPDVDAITTALVQATWGSFARAYEGWRRWSDYDLDHGHRDFVARYLAYMRTPARDWKALPGMTDAGPEALPDGRG